MAESCCNASDVERGILPRWVNMGAAHRRPMRHYQVSLEARSWPRPSAAIAGGACTHQVTSGELKVGPDRDGHDVVGFGGRLPAAPMADRLLR
jgi:hypothetical protein